MYPENQEGTQVIVGSINMEYISDTAKNRTHNLFRPKREPIPLGHNDGLHNFCVIVQNKYGVIDSKKLSTIVLFIYLFIRELSLSAVLYTTTTYIQYIM